MKEQTDEQVRETRARSGQKGKVEMPPLLTDEDEAALDAAWKGVDSVGDAKAVKPALKK